MQDFSKYLREGDNLEDWCVGKTGCAGRDWIHLAWDWDHWWVIMNTLMNIKFPLNVDNFLTS